VLRPPLHLTKCHETLGSCMSIARSTRSVKCQIRPFTSVEPHANSTQTFATTIESSHLSRCCRSLSVFWKKLRLGGPRLRTPDPETLCTGR